MFYNIEINGKDFFVHPIHTFVHNYYMLQLWAKHHDLKNNGELSSDKNF